MPRIKPKQVREPDPPPDNGVTPGGHGTRDEGGQADSRTQVEATPVADELEGPPEPQATEGVGDHGAPPPVVNNGHHQGPDQADHLTGASEDRPTSKGAEGAAEPQDSAEPQPSADSGGQGPSTGPQSGAEAGAPAEAPQVATGQGGTNGEASLEELAVQIKAACQQAEDSVRDALNKGLEYARDAGERLLEAQQKVPQGQWTKWLESSCNMKLRTAQAYMRVVREWETIKKAQRVAPLSFRQALKLLGTPRQAAGDDQRVGESAPKPGGSSSEVGSEDQSAEEGQSGEEAEKEVKAEDHRVNDRKQGATLSVEQTTGVNGNAGEPPTGNGPREIGAQATGMQTAGEEKTPGTPAAPMPPSEAGDASGPSLPPATQPQPRKDLCPASAPHAQGSQARQTTVPDPIYQQVDDWLDRADDEARRAFLTHLLDRDEVKNMVLMLIER